LLLVYWCDTWSATSRREDRLDIFENRGPRKLFGYNREKVKGGWRKLLNGIYNLLCTAVIRVMKEKSM
jgi:hypothetical protein